MAVYHGHAWCLRRRLGKDIRVSGPGITDGPNPSGGVIGNQIWSSARVANFFYPEPSLQPLVCSETELSYVMLDGLEFNR